MRSSPRPAGRSASSLTRAAVQTHRRSMSWFEGQGAGLAERRHQQMPGCQDVIAKAALGSNREEVVRSSSLSHGTGPSSCALADTKFDAGAPEELTG